MSSGEATGRAADLFEAGAWLVAVVALTRCYYERENLWTGVVGGKSLTT
jgi:hypothetical protein